MVKNCFYSTFAGKMVRIKVLIPIIVCILALSVHCQNSEEDNDFAEFDDFDSDDEFEAVSEHTAKNERQSNVGGKNDHFQDVYDENDDDDGVVEEESEFEHFRDDEEFEGFNKNDQAAPTESGEPKLTMVTLCVTKMFLDLYSLQFFTGESSFTF